MERSLLLYNSVVEVQRLNSYLQHTLQGEISNTGDVSELSYEERLAVADQFKILMEAFSDTIEIVAEYRKLHNEIQAATGIKN